MKSKTTLLMLLVSLFALSQLPFFVQVAYAREEISLMDIPELLGEAFGVSTFAGGLIASLIFSVMVLLPSGMLIRGRHASLVMIIEGLGVFAICIAIAWLPLFLIIVLCMIIALLFSGNVRDWLSGGGK